MYLLAQYEQYDCERLTVEADSLSRRESQLVIAQEQRLKSSKVQAFWLGYGQGDGNEASELANVRGEREAVRKAMDANKCAAPMAPSGGLRPGVNRRVPTSALRKWLALA